MSYRTKLARPRDRATVSKRGRGVARSRDDIDSRANIDDPMRRVDHVSEDLFERRGTAPRPRRIPCEFCGAPLVDPIEEPFNIAFIDHLKANERCMTLFGYGMTALRNELGVRLGQKPMVDGL